MGNLNLGGSWIDEYIKIAAEKGWVEKKAQFSEEEVLAMWEKLSEEGRDEVLPGWEKMLVSELLHILKWKLPQLQIEMDKQMPEEERLGRIEESDKPKHQSSPLIKDVQNALAKYFGNPRVVGKGGPDSVWGPFTARAWNTWIEKTGNDGLGRVDPDGVELPSKESMDWLVNTWVPKFFAEKKLIPETGKPIDVELPTLQGPDEAKTGPMPEEHIPSLSNDGVMEANKRGEGIMTNINENVKKLYPMASAAIEELTSLANDLESMGESNAAMAVDEQTKLYKKAVDKLYDITGETGENLIEQAHPGGGPTIAPAREEGGKVETIVEEQKKNIEKATKNPTGKYAEAVLKLVAVANKLEEEGKTEEAQIVDKAIEELRASVLPFPDRSLVIEAANSEDKNASINKEAVNKYLDKYMPEWNSVVAKTDDIWKEVSGVATGTITTLSPVFSNENLDKLRKSMKLGQGIIEETKVLWNSGSLDKSSLASRIKAIINLSGIKEEDIWNAMDALFLFSEKANKYKIKYRNMLGAWKNLYSKLMKTKAKSDALMGKIEPSTLLSTYRASLRKLQKSLKIPNNKLLMVLGKGDADKGIKAWKLLKSWTEKELIKEYEEEEALRKNRSLWQKLLKGLQHAGISIAKETLQHMTKEAQDDLPITIEKEDKKKAPGKPGARRRPKDAKVAQLQEMLGTITKLPVSKKGGSDGLWGQMTALAWNTFRDTISREFKGMPTISVATPDKVPSDIGAAIRLANYYLKERGRSDMENINIPLAGKTIQSKDLENLNTFRNALFLAGLKGDTKKYIMMLYNALQGRLGAYLDAYYKTPGLVNNLKDKVKNIGLEFMGKKKPELALPEWARKPEEKKEEEKKEEGGKKMKEDLRTASKMLQYIHKHLPSKNKLTRLFKFTPIAIGKYKDSYEFKNYVTQRLGHKKPSEEDLAAMYFDYLRTKKYYEVIKELNKNRAHIEDKNEWEYIDDYMSHWMDLLGALGREIPAGTRTPEGGKVF